MAIFCSVNGESHYVCIECDWSTFVFYHSIYSGCVVFFSLLDVILCAHDVLLLFVKCLVIFFFIRSKLCNSDSPIFRILFCYFFFRSNITQYFFGFGQRRKKKLHSCWHHTSKMNENTTLVNGPTDEMKEKKIIVYTK